MAGSTRRSAPERVSRFECQASRRQHGPRRDYEDHRGFSAYSDRQPPQQPPPPHADRSGLATPRGPRTRALAPRLRIPPRRTAGGCGMSPNPPPPSPPRRVAIYTRARDDEGLRRQREDVERHIAQRPDWAVVAVYEEVELPHKKRPALDRLLADAKNGVIDLVAARDLPRLGRSMEAFADVVRVLDNCGVGIVTAAEKVDTQTSQGRLFMAVLTGFVDSFRDAQRAHSRGVR
ncbi:recombinase family protein [Blastococcus sp. HT6-30]|uniref:recombinase family protein n=1 Tax=Blastococcus sp. HT6-30 TaxID=3144843 RepID=UPI00321A76F3